MGRNAFFGWFPDAHKAVSYTHLDVYKRQVLVSDSLPIGAVIEEILLLDQCSKEADWAAGVIYLPLR